MSGNNKNHLIDPGLNINNSLGDDTNLLEPTSTRYFSSGDIQSRDYKCPRCRGEFNKWETKYEVEGDILTSDEIVGSTRKPGISPVEMCPFCDLQKGEYNHE